MNENIYYLKRYVPVLEDGESFHIGLGDKNVKLSKTTENRANLDRLVIEGIRKEEIPPISFFQEIESKNLLTTDLKAIRKDMYFDYLGVPMPSAEKLSSKILILGCGAGGATTAYLLNRSGPDRSAA